MACDFGDLVAFVARLASNSHVHTHNASLAPLGTPQWVEAGSLFAARAGVLLVPRVESLARKCLAALAQCVARNDVACENVAACLTPASRAAETNQLLHRPFATQCTVFAVLDLLNSGGGSKRASGLRPNFAPLMQGVDDSLLRAFVLVVTTADADNNNNDDNDLTSEHDRVDDSTALRELVRQLQQCTTRIDARANELLQLFYNAARQRAHRLGHAAAMLRPAHLVALARLAGAHAKASERACARAYCSTFFLYRLVVSTSRCCA